MHTRKTLLTVMVALFALTNTGGALAQESNATFLDMDATMGLVQGIYIHIDNLANGNCWTNPETITSKMKSAFELLDIPVKDEPAAVASNFYPDVVISVLSERTASGHCYGHGEIAVIVGATNEYGDEREGKYISAGLPGELFSHASIFFNDSNHNNQIDDLAQDFAADFAARVMAGKQEKKVKSLLAKYPELSNYVTQGEVDRGSTEQPSTKEKGEQ